MRKGMFLFLTAIFSLSQISCTTTGPSVNSQELAEKRTELEAKAARYKEAQLARVTLIANRLIQFMPPETQNKLKDIQIEVSDEADINASASFNKLTVNYGMLRFTESDDQLATVIAHELAHVVRGHVGKSLATNIVAGTVGLAAGTAINSLGGGVMGSVVSQGVSKGISGAFSRDFEREADYYGFQYLYVAGFEVTKGAEIWERFAIEAPKSMTSNLFSTHPSSPERLLRAEKILIEMNTQGVVPNLFRNASLSLPIPSVLTQKVAPLGLVSSASPSGSSSKSSAGNGQSGAKQVSTTGEAQDELTQLRQQITQLRLEQQNLEKNIQQKQKIQLEQAELERSLAEAQEASKQLRYAEFGIQDLGIAKKVTNLWIAKKVNGEQRIFSLNEGGIDWFVQYNYMSLNSFKALGLHLRKYRIYWYSPNKRLYSEHDFMQSQVRAEFAKTTLQWDRDLGDYIIGEWHLRVFEGGKLIDERTFEVIR